jgi:hypothetical protein
VNQFTSQKKISKLEIMEFLDTLEGISGNVENSIYCMDEPDPQKIDGYINPLDYNGLAFTKRPHMQIWLHDCGTVTVHKIIDVKGNSKMFDGHGKDKVQ